MRQWQAPTRGSCSPVTVIVTAPQRQWPVMGVVSAEGLVCIGSPEEVWDVVAAIRAIDVTGDSERPPSNRRPPAGKNDRFSPADMAVVAIAGHRNPLIERSDRGGLRTIPAPFHPPEFTSPC